MIFARRRGARAAFLRSNSQSIIGSPGVIWLTLRVENHMGLETRKPNNLRTPSTPVPKGEGPGAPSASVGNLTGIEATRENRTGREARKPKNLRAPSFRVHCGRVGIEPLAVSHIIRYSCTQ